MTDLKIPQYTVIQYVRNKKRIPYGVVVAIKDSDAPLGFRFGYSLCNKKDRFNKAMALKVALGRANVEWHNSPPRDINKIAASFLDRCKKYYKTNA